MKTAVLILLFYNSLFQPDVYYITFVKGRVQLESSKKDVKVGDKIAGSDKLIFSDQSSKVSCISPSKGRFDITPGASKATVKSEWLAVISTNLVPSSSQYHLSSRSVGMQTGYDPINYFVSQDDRPIVLFNGEGLPVAVSYKLDDRNFFFVQYEFQGKTVVHKIPHKNRALIFSNELFSDDKDILIPTEQLQKVTLCYQSLENSVPHSKALVTFRPVLIDKNDLVKEINVLYMYLKPLKKNDPKAIRSEIFAHLTNNYGIMNENEFGRQFQDILK